MNLHVQATALQRKLSAGMTITADDLATAATVAGGTQRQEHRILYAELKQAHAAANATEPEEEKQEPVTAEQVEAAKAAAKANPTAKNCAVFATLKRQYEAQGETK